MIESAENNLVKNIVKLKEKKHRDEQGLFVIEGEKFVDEIINYKVVQYIVSEDYQNKWKYEQKAKTVVVKNHLFKKMCDTVNPQGILAVCRQKQYDIKDMMRMNNPFIVIGEKISDPGNLGTIIRTADAAGASGLILSKNSTDIYNPKVLRSTAGSIFHLPIITDMDLDRCIPKLKEQGFTLFGAHLSGHTLPYSLDLKNSTALVIGNEANGLTQSTSDLLDDLVKIPMLGSAESLNASVACGILIYEIVRQRIVNYSK